MLSPTCMQGSRPIKSLIHASTPTFRLFFHLGFLFYFIIVGRKRFAPPPLSRVLLHKRKRCVCRSQISSLSISCFRLMLSGCIGGIVILRTSILLRGNVNHITDTFGRSISWHLTRTLAGPRPKLIKLYRFSSGKKYTAIEIYPLH